MKHLSLFSLFVLGLLFISLNGFSQNNFLDFDGAGHQVLYTFPGASPLDNSQTVTMELWVNPDNLGTFDHFIDLSNVFRFQIQGGSGLSLVITFSGVTIHPLPGVLTTGTWQHYAVVFDGALSPTERVKIYKDGVLLGPNVSEPRVNIGSVDFFRIGSWISGLNADAKIDEVRIWSTPRSAMQINDNMNIELTGTETGLFAYYKFNEGVCGGNNAGVTVAADSGPNGFDANLTGFDLTGGSGSPPGCGSNWVCAGGPCTIPDNGVGTSSVVPTLGQWGLIVFFLLILTYGTLHVRRTQPALAGAGGTQVTGGRFDWPFESVRYGKLLVGVLLTVVAIFALAIALFGYELTSADIPGTLVAAPVLAYWLMLVTEGGSGK